jgi:bifunctional DNA-binding transcriptional regulator/antitoxin component of YhaV-PrlF toxin-antitoxin module
MIKWRSNFNIEESTVQLAEAFVKVENYLNINNHSIVTIIISDETGNIIVKEYTKNYERTFNNTYEVYEELIHDFPDSELI